MDSEGGKPRRLRAVLIAILAVAALAWFSARPLRWLEPGREPARGGDRHQAAQLAKSAVLPGSLGTSRSTRLAQRAAPVRSREPHSPAGRAGNHDRVATDRAPGTALGPGDSQIVVSPPQDAGPPDPHAILYVVDLPAAIRKVPPAYPEPARVAHIEGTVVVQALVGKDGRVRAARIQKSIPMLDSAAVVAVRQWRFEPPRLKQQPVAVWVAVPVTFTLR